MSTEDTHIHDQTTSIAQAQGNDAVIQVTRVSKMQENYKKFLNKNVDITFSAQNAFLE